MPIHRRLFVAMLVALAILPCAAVADPPVIPLWENGPPGFEGRRNEAEVIDKGTITNIHFPTLTAFLPEPGRANGVGIIVAPGGGLSKLGFQGGGVEPARFLADHGFAAFVLKYRLPREPGAPYKFEEHSLQDGQRAVRLVRSKAAEFGINPETVGMLGFSAGGEVVAAQRAGRQSEKKGATSIPTCDEASGSPHPGSRRRWRAKAGCRKRRRSRSAASAE